MRQDRDGAGMSKGSEHVRGKDVQKAEGIQVQVECSLHGRNEFGENWEPYCD